ncbi:ATP-binding cassette domain-containing protein [Paenibacillus sp. VCA1]|uniref:ATP-binding cassette domain-containing protein n=1 Tax=Paenibacillus sp. VCA1 TaxID=3039148 RepID=UPI0028720B4C|nr:ATP-binding cassette domain-containing protein [Paenibacillus sp. VCA1]MDR9853993.1 ATP-binding cassette domain-containing protein [Paenibacillus sp. VCA1]
MAYRLNDVSVHYAGKTALRSVSCTMEEGKWISVIGHTGAGKSTFAKVLKGLIPSIDGEYFIRRQPVQRDAKGRLKAIPEIGFVFQYPEHQLFETSVYKELSFSLKHQGASVREIREAIDGILPEVGLDPDILPLVPLQLSGGYKRRVAIASALISDPKLLIVDEPTAGLDPLGSRAVLTMLKRWQRQNDRTVIFISHQMEDVAEYSDEVMVFHAGRLMGHFDANVLFLEHSQWLEELGLPLPEPVQLLKLLKDMSGRKIETDGCREEEIFEKIMPIWDKRGF